jgi:Holliday junction resolvasome RuvABC endonuclease subunit
LGVREHKSLDAADALAIAYHHSLQMDLIKRLKGTGIEL